MRYVKVSLLREGMIVGQDIASANGKVFLKKNSELTMDNISYLSFIGIQGIYIDDEFSKEAEIKDLVRPEVRNNALRLVHQFFRKSDGGPLPESEKHILENVQQVVNDVLSNKDVMYNLVEVKSYDDYTYFHSVNVGILAGIIGMKCKLDRTTIEDLVTAAFLHDIGKIFIDIEIIHAPRRLNDQERIRMMEHPRLGYELLEKNFRFPESVNRTVLEHHEWYNGLGYPNHRGGNDLLFTSRVLKAADVYDAMTSKRPYHPPYLPSEVMEYIMGRSGMEFDPAIVEVMSRSMCVYPVGCEVELSNSERAIVISNHEGYVLRPTVKLIRTGDVIDLQSDHDALNLTIVKLMM